MRLLRASIVTGLAAAAVLGQAQTDSALGIDFDSNVYKVDITTGTGTFLFHLGLTNTNCMAHFGGMWYTIDDQARLWRFTSSGAKSLVYTLDFGGATDVRGLAFDAGQTMNVVLNKAGSDELWSVDFGTGFCSRVGPLGSASIQGLAITVFGLPYAYDTSTTNSGGLKRVDLPTGLATDLDPSSPGNPGVQDLFVSGATLLGGRDSLYKLSESSGAESLVGAGGYADVRGWARKQSVNQIVNSTVKLGKRDFGSTASLERRDTRIFRVMKFIVPNSQVDPINVEVEYESGMSHQNDKETAVIWIGRTTVAGSFRLKLEIFNRSTNLWETIQNSAINTTMSEHFGVRSGTMAPYYADNRMLARYTVRPAGPVSSSQWGVEVEMLRVEEIEKF